MTNTVFSSHSSASTTLRELIQYPDRGLSKKVLLADENCQYTLLCLRKGTNISEHTASRNASITVIEGYGTFTLEEKEILLEPGVFLFMPANTRHAVKTRDNLAFLLTLSEPSQPKNQLSKHTIDVVKSTAPILKKNGKQITTRMYEIMFGNHPEVKEQFDASAQADGSQPTKLATAIYSYASHIDNLDALKSAVEKIAHRHVQTHVTAEQYPIVGESLLQAMKDVLGEIATDEVMAAWTEAYGVLAEIFINREHQIYESQGV
ncbi:cupin domain-containing protein [Oscillatoriales cyanobacterium LEGE 11467]|uniref:Cupin domain-containing protein n=1 Tax=Zarconia navalis LEGE 11467 TaxID=1828826 RepID=A0A928VUP3_9CYAN|nr:globin domain-containing protein [Zarconia navalis]MBE9040476.1 cupin domain-containing protein [Zarconia navalis LEGE 11467]